MFANKTLSCINGHQHTISLFRNPLSAPIHHHKASKQKQWWQHYWEWKIFELLRGRGGCYLLDQCQVDASASAQIWYYYWVGRDTGTGWATLSVGHTRPLLLHTLHLIIWTSSTLLTSHQSIATTTHPIGRVTPSLPSWTTAQHLYNKGKLINVQLFFKEPLLFQLSLAVPTNSFMYLAGENRFWCDKIVFYYSRVLRVCCRHLFSVKSIICNDAK